MDKRIVRLEDEHWKIRTDMVEIPESEQEELKEYFNDNSISVKSAKSEDLDSFISYISDKNLSSSAIFLPSDAKNFKSLESCPICPGARA